MDQPGVFLLLEIFHVRGRTIRILKERGLIAGD
jgi:hypothetical protein